MTIDLWIFEYFFNASDELVEKLGSFCVVE